MDYGKLYLERNRILRLACSRFEPEKAEGYPEFCRENAYWLEDYSLFMALKEAHGGKKLGSLGRTSAQAGAGSASGVPPEEYAKDRLLLV